MKLTDQGGINVSSKNVSLVTNEMFANALITSGILNCEVIVSAPFMVTGESALAGILAGAEGNYGRKVYLKKIRLLLKKKKLIQH